MFHSAIRASIAAAAFFTVHSATAEAQIMRRPVARKPTNWLGANVGIVRAYALSDGVTSATWRFGSGIEYAGRLEHPTRSGISVGVQGSHAQIPLSYSSGTSPSCTSCEATATVTQFVGLVHYGQGYGFHPVYELSVGAIGYSNFRRESDNQQITGPSGRTLAADYDLRFALGYGFGFGLSPTTAIEVLQEVGTILHQTTGLAASTSNYPRVYVTRLGGKIAF